MTHSTTPSMRAGLFVWGFGALFYLLSFFHRVAPAVITGELMQEFQINAAALGNLSAVYFYSYVAMQIPTGILADRFGPRRLLTIGALVSAVGAMIFAMAPEISWAIAGRLLIGGSVAVAFVSLLKLAACWFALNRFALVSGLALLFGTLGAVFAGPPLRLLVNSLGWRYAMFFSVGLTLIVAMGTWLFVRDFPHEKGFKDFPNAPSTTAKTQGASVLKDVLHVLTYRNIILLFFIPGASVGCVLTFAGLWGVPYLTTLYGLTPTKAATLTSTLLVAWAIGGPFFGWLSDRLGNRKTVYLTTWTFALAGWATLILFQPIPIMLLVPLLIVTGFTSGSIIIGLAYAKESVPIRFAGTVSGVANMGLMLGPMVLQPIVGYVLDKMWSGSIVDGVRLYSAAAYKSAFGLMLIWMVVSFVLLMFTRETKCRQFHTN